MNKIQNYILTLIYLLILVFYFLQNLNGLYVLYSAILLLLIGVIQFLRLKNKKNIYLILYLIALLVIVFNIYVYNKLIV